MYRSPQLIRDGTVLPLTEAAEVWSQRGGPAVVPTVFGTNRDESKLFLLFGSEHVRRAFGIPMWLGDEQAYDLQSEYLSNMWKATGADEPAAGLRTLHDDVFVYRFDWDEEPRLLWADLSKMLGAAHAVEIPFVFGLMDLGRANRFLWDDERTAARDELSDAMMSYWAQFAYTGDPGRGRSGTLETWRRWNPSSADAPKFLVFDTREGGGIRMSSDTVSGEKLLARLATDDRIDSQRARCELYRSFAERGRGFDEDDYATVANGACRDFPFDAYPWND